MRTVLTKIRKIKPAQINKCRAQNELPISSEQFFPKISGVIHPMYWEAVLRSAIHHPWNHLATSCLRWNKQSCISSLSWIIIIVKSVIRDWHKIKALTVFRWTLHTLAKQMKYTSCFAKTFIFIHTFHTFLNMNTVHAHSHGASTHSLRFCL